MKNTNDTNNNYEQELQVSIANLYEGFSRYELREKMDACTCGCISPEDMELIYSRALHDLAPEELEKYSGKALTTWGDTHDFRHFLPRLFELSANDPYAPWDMEILFSKLKYGNWETWNEKEQKIIKDYFFALWKNFLRTNEPGEYSDSDSYLCAFSQALDDPAPFLDIWLNVDDKLAYLHLKLFIQWNKDDLRNHELGNPFWEERQTQMHIVINWLLSSERTEFFKTKQGQSTGLIKNLIAEILEQLETI